MSRWSNPRALPLVPLTLVFVGVSVALLLTKPPLQWLAGVVLVLLSGFAFYLWLTTPWPVAILTVQVQEASVSEWVVRLHVAASERVGRARGQLSSGQDVSLEAVAVVGQWQDLTEAAGAAETLFLTELRRRWPAAQAWRWHEDGRATIVFVRPGTRLT